MFRPAFDLAGWLTLRDNREFAHEFPRVGSVTPRHLSSLHVDVFSVQQPFPVIVLLLRAPFIVSNQSPLEI